MSRLAKLFVLVPLLANAACSEPLEPVIIEDSVTCEIAGVTITAGNPNALSFGVYGFDAEASGGTVECTGDRIDDFVQELPAHKAAELYRNRFWVRLEFTFPTPLGLMQLDNSANLAQSADAIISADYWNGRVFVFAPRVDPDMEFPFNGRGRFTAVRR